MSCRWVHLPSLESAEHLCGKPGDPHCEDHALISQYLRQVDSFAETDEPFQELSDPEFPQY